MRKITKVSGVVATAALLFVVGLSPAMAETVDAVVTGGNLSASTPSPAMTGVALDGSTKRTSATTTTDWSLKDPRGTGAAWSLTASATDFTSAAAVSSTSNASETTLRTIAVGNLTITPGTITAGIDSDVVGSLVGTAQTMSVASATSPAKTLVKTSGGNKGTYTMPATFSLNIPANTFRSNYVSGTTGPQNAYISTVTYTIG